ncbi:hypothetical protein DHEL01_v205241 [Diaporthe helianthi]|uniref:Uncharacterized protein n=1 Tax=Diaporthe helianthi TaxID=158607 RepID=A0A2P5I1K3_DIAHE|nr:hypothetical protein DHEL01_v205241 [Diaporthe helianthi]
MSKGQTSDAQQLKPPEEQERQIKEWVPKERLSSTVTTKFTKPTPPLPNDKKEPDRSTGARLRQRLQQVRTWRMFGDNPLLERQPAPFPEGP